jgi:hypothetical protein
VTLAGFLNDGCLRKNQLAVLTALRRRVVRPLGQIRPTILLFTRSSAILLVKKSAMADNALYEILGVPTKATDAELKKVVMCSALIL